MRAYPVLPRLCRCLIAVVPARRHVVALCAVALALPLTGCGQTGALYLPEPDAGSAEEGAVAEDPNAPDADRDDDTP